MLLSIPDVILDKILSCLDLDDVSIVVVLCKYTSSIKKQIYESALYAKIYEKYTVWRIVENCPKIKHLTICSSEFGKEHVNLIHRLNLETLVNKNSNTPGFTLKFKTLKNLEVWDISDFDITDCPALENIITVCFSERTYKAANLKSIKIRGYPDVDELSNWPVTELRIKPRSLLDAIEFPLDTLTLEVDENPNKSISILKKTKLKSLSIQFHHSDDHKVKIRHDIDLPSLRSLELESVELSLNKLKCLTGLTELSLDNCSLECDAFEHISRLPITKLSLSRIKIDLSELRKFKLRYLTLYDCEIIGRMYFPKTLRHLEIMGENTIIDEMPNIALDTLKICSTDPSNPIKITNDGLAAISKLPITVLELTECGLNDDNIGYLANMQINQLSIEGNDITIVGLRKLNRLPLRKLEVSTVPLLHMALF